MITGAALCPSPPLLYPGVTGREAVLPDLRAACADAVGRLLCDGPEMIVVVGPAPATGSWDPAGRRDPSVFAPGIASTRRQSLPLSLSLASGGMFSRCVLASSIRPFRSAHRPSARCAAG